MTITTVASGNGRITGQVLTSASFTDINTFKNPNNVFIKPFNGFHRSDKSITVDMPPKSVVVLELK